MDKVLSSTLACSILSAPRNGTHLQTRVDGEGTGCGVHAGHVLRVVDVLQGQFGSVVPVTVVNVLANQSVGLHRVVFVHLQAENVAPSVD